MPYCQWQEKDLLLWVKVQPRSSKNGFAESYEDEIKIRITAPPVDGKANSHLPGWLSKQSGVAKSSVSLLAGESSRHKRIKISRPMKVPDEIRQALNPDI